jgi:hypothetical protein
LAKIATIISVLVILFGIGIGTTVQFACLNKKQKNKYFRWIWLSWVCIVVGSCVAMWSTILS